MSAALGLLPVLQFGSLYALHVVRAARRDPKPARQLPLPPTTATPTPLYPPTPFYPPNTHTPVCTLLRCVRHSSMAQRPSRCT